MKLIYKKANTLTLFVVFLYGYIVFLFTNKTPYHSYRAMRELFVRTQGGLNNFMGLLSRIRRAKKTSNLDTSLFAGASIEPIIQDLHNNGYHLFSKQLPSKYIDALLHSASTTPASYVIVQKNNTFKIQHSQEREIFDPNNLKSPRYFFTMQELLGFESLQDLLFEPFFLEVARRYLQCEPVLDLYTMWWSAPFGKKATAETAQMYHFDMDRLRFLKIFFYLNDVTPHNGPHMYVENSHKKLPKKFYDDRRFEDEEIAEAFAPEQIKQVCAPKGSIIFADTRALHKGEALLEGKRLIFQIEFANNLFGAQYPKIDPDEVKETFHDTIAKNPYAYQLFKI